MIKEAFLKSIIQIDYPEDKYVKKEYQKTQIVLHHTVSNSSALDVANYWKTLPNKIGTCIIIERNGNICQLFSSKYYAGHLGLTPGHFNIHGIPYTDLNKSSIGVELISWGGLTQKDGKMFNTYGKEVINEPISVLQGNYRGYKYFHSYTEKQLSSLKDLLIYWGERYEIPLIYNLDMWDISEDALEGYSGIWSHTSFRKDKSDIFPQKEMIDMLKSLK